MAQVVEEDKPRGDNHLERVDWDIHPVGGWGDAGCLVPCFGAHLAESDWVDSWLVVDSSQGRNFAEEESDSFLVAEILGFVVEAFQD